MKKKILLSLLTLVIGFYQSFADTNYKLVKCERYGTDVVIIYNIENTNSFDVTALKRPNLLYSIAGNGIVVLDADGNQYKTSDFTYGQLRERDFDGDIYIGGSKNASVPVGKSEISSDGITIPGEMQLSMRVVVRNVPRDLDRFSFIELYGTTSWGSQEGSFSLVYNQEEDGDKLKIETVK